jgi:thiamine biosynthesis lipoprotein
MMLMACSAEEDARPVTFSGATMGTTYTVTMDALPADVSLSTLRQDVGAILDRIEDRMSTYDDASELSRFNANQTTDWVAMSAETVDVVDAAIAVSELTDGGFDITVGPLVDLWGFGPAAGPPAIPSDDAIAAILERVGYRQVRTRREPPALRKSHPEVEIDLSAIAKGYAVDEVAEYLESVDVSDFLIEVGGEMRARGRHPRGVPWRIGIERPVPGPRSVHRVLLLENAALATSGDYRNFFEVEGWRFSHTIDPRTGRPVTHALASVSVVDVTAMRADALATGLTVLGPAAGRALAQREDLAVLFIERDGASFHEDWTPALARALSDEE